VLAKSAERVLNGAWWLLAHAGGHAEVKDELTNHRKVKLLLAV